MEAKLRALELKSRIHRKGQRGRPLSEQAKRGNRTRSSVRGRVEHVFGAQVKDMGGTLLRTIGLARASAKLGMKNLAYNEQDQELIRGINSLTNAPPRPAATPEPMPGVTPRRATQASRREMLRVTGQALTGPWRPGTPTGGNRRISSCPARSARPRSGQESEVPLRPIPRKRAAVRSSHLHGAPVAHAHEVPPHASRRFQRFRIRRTAAESGSAAVEA